MSQVLAIGANLVQMISLVIILAAIEPLIIVVLVAIAVPYLFFVAVGQRAVRVGV